VQSGAVEKFNAVPHYLRSVSGPLLANTFLCVFASRDTGDDIIVDHKSAGVALYLKVIGEDLHSF
jgi:hypothetical protein